MAGTEMVGASGERAPVRWLPIIVATLFTILTIAHAWLAASPWGSTVCPANYPAPRSCTIFGRANAAMATTLVALVVYPAILLLALEGQRLQARLGARRRSYFRLRDALLVSLGGVGFRQRLNEGA